MDCCQFEPKIQVECALEILRILRGGDAIAQKGDLLEHAGCLIGGIGAYLNSLDEPHLMGESPNDLPCNLDECCDEVEASLGGMQASESRAISPAMLALLLRLAELLISKSL